MHFLIRSSSLWSGDKDIYRKYWSPNFSLHFSHSCRKSITTARIAHFAPRMDVDLCTDRCFNQMILQLPSVSSKLFLVLDVPFIILVRVLPRTSALLFIHFPLVAIRIRLVVVVLRVALHPFEWNACARILIDAVDRDAEDVALFTKGFHLSEGLRCNCGCQDGEGRSFHQINF